MELGLVWLHVFIGKSKETQMADHWQRIIQKGSMKQADATSSKMKILAMLQYQYLEISYFSWKIWALAQKHKSVQEKEIIHVAENTV